MAALGNILISAYPTPSGTVTSKYRDGNDAGASPPTTPQIGQPNVLNDDAVDIPLVTASTGGTAPRVYELSLSTTSEVAGFSVKNAAADFTGDGVLTEAGLTASSTYWAKLACVDADLRRSGYSGIYTFTTAAAGGGDTTAPTAPTSVSAVSSVVGQAVYAWTNGTDAIGITATDVWRGDADGAGNPIGSGTVIAPDLAPSDTSYTDLSAPAGQQVWYSAQHRDAAGNVSTASAKAYVTIASEAAQTKRWNPGHYIKTQGSDSRTDQANYWGGASGVLATMDKAATFSTMKGAFVTVAWGSFNTTGTTYSWTDLDALFTKADSLGQKLILSISYKNNAPASAGLIGPADLLAADAVTNSSGHIMCLWRQSVMDRYIAAIGQLYARYGSRSAFELLTTSESAPSTPAAGSGYSVAGLSAQLQRLYAAQGATFQNLYAYANMNFLGNQAAPLIEAAYQAGLGHGTPDAFDDTGNKIFRGVQVTNAGTTVRDYRGKIPHPAVASGPVLGGKDDNGPATNIINWAQTNEVTHLCWVTTVTVAGNTWADIKTAITADPLLHSTAPTG